MWSVARQYHLTTVEPAHTCSKRRLSYVTDCQAPGVTSCMLQWHLNLCVSHRKVTHAHSSCGLTSCRCPCESISVLIMYISSIDLSPAEGSCIGSLFELALHHPLSVGRVSTLTFHSALRFHTPALEASADGIEAALDAYLLSKLRWQLQSW